MKFKPEIIRPQKNEDDGFFDMLGITVARRNVIKNTVSRALTKGVTKKKTPAEMLIDCVAYCRNANEVSIAVFLFGSQYDFIYKKIKRKCKNKK